MTYEEEIKYSKLIQKAANRTIAPSEERELNRLGGIRVRELIKARQPAYEWDYPIKKKE